MSECKFEYCDNTIVQVNPKVHPRDNKIFCSRDCKNKHYTNIARRDRKNKCVEYLGGECIRCGFSEHQAALQFHHRIVDDKEFGISRAEKSATWKMLKEELDKCDLLCANCHAIEHYE